MEPSVQNFLTHQTCSENLLYLRITLMGLIFCSFLSNLWIIAFSHTNMIKAYLSWWNFHEPCTHIALSREQNPYPPRAIPPWTRGYGMHARNVEKCTGSSTESEAWVFAKCVMSQSFLWTMLTLRSCVGISWLNPNWRANLLRWYCLTHILLLTRIGRLNVYSSKTQNDNPKFSHHPKWHVQDF